ncbi:MAG: class I SAM-dependent methyltransferase [Candidatus Natronoplasma sp.]
MSWSIFEVLAPIYGPISRMLFSDTWSEIISQIDLSNEDTVLDVGGGQGILLESLQKEKPGIDVVLLDSSLQMVRRSKTNKVLGNASKNPFSDGSFDHILCLDALHHFENKKESLREMIRVLKHDGDIIILELDTKSPLTKFIEFVEKLLGEPSYFFEPEVLERFFSNNGFETTIHTLNSYEYILQAKKSD